MPRSTVTPIQSHSKKLGCLRSTRKCCRVYPHHIRIVVACASLIVFVSCAGYVPGRQAYWDEQIRQLCEKDGGVTIYERISISKADIARQVLPKSADGRLSVSIKDLAHPEAPVYAVEHTTYIGAQRTPRVSRTEMSVIRRSDKFTVATWISYGRFGGDLPTGLAHDSSFVCPDVRTSAAELARLFIVEGDSHD